MSIRIEAPSHDAVREIAENMREADLREFLAVSWAGDRLELAGVMEDRYGDHPGGYCAFLDDRPVAFGAMVEGRPNVVTLAFFATDDFPKVALGLTRFIVKRLFPRYRNLGVHRIEAISIEDYETAHRWIGSLGLTREAVLKGYGKGGETYHQFAWVKR